MLVGCPDTSQDAHGGGTLDEEVFEAYTFFHFFLSLFLAPANFDAGMDHFMVVSWEVAIGMMPIEVIPEFTDMAYGARYPICITKSILDSVSVSMTWCETKPGGEYKKGV